VPASRESLSPEARLLLLTASQSPNDAALREVLSAGINWDELRTLARHEKAASVLFRQLGRVALPPETGNSGYQELRQLATVSVMEMLRLEQLLHETLDILAQEQVEAVLLKGAGLAYTAYHSLADRPMGDIDLLVRTKDAERAWSLLQTHDWRPRPMDGGLPRYEGHHHLPPLVRDSGRFRLEIHDQLMPRESPFRFSADAIWRSAKQVTVNGRAMTVPSPVHQLWHACVHFAWSHIMQWGSWRTLRDTAAIIERHGIDWAEFVSFAKETRAATCCFWTLRLTRRVTGAPVPDDVLASLRPPHSAFIIERLERHFVSSLFPSENSCPSVWLTRRLWEAGISPRWSGHGATRPWQVAERWLAAGEPDGSSKPVGRAVIEWLRHIGAGVTYLLRLTRFVLPITVTAQTSV
jgi:hypothetical protein